MNQALKADLQEGTDYMMVTPRLYNHLRGIYSGTGKPVIRYGIDSGQNETSVEINLTRVQICAYGSASLNFEVPHFFYISRKAKFMDLRKKIQRILNKLVMKEAKVKTIKDLRIWKHKTGNMGEIALAGVKFEKESEVEIGATLLDGESEETVDDWGLAGPEEILIVEVKMVKKGGWVFKEVTPKAIEEEETESTQAESS